jgi:hypothetical protein
VAWWWIGNYVEGGGHGIFQCTILAFIWRDWWKPMKNVIRMVGVLAKIQTSTSQYKSPPAPTYSICFFVANSEGSKHVVVYYIMLLSLHIQNTNIITLMVMYYLDDLKILLPRCHRMTKIFSWTATLCKFILLSKHLVLFSETVQEYHSLHHHVKWYIQCTSHSHIQ